MLKWKDVLDYGRNGNLPPNKRVEKTQDEWRSLLSDEQFRITRQHGTEAAFSSEMCGLLEAGLYSCVCCNTLLFDATEKFDSGTGWPSFTQPVEENAIAYHEDTSHGMSRVETTCNTCDAHLGHVFPDGPQPSGLRYCMNAVALNKVTEKTETAIVGGGCFWCTEAIFSKLKGVKSVRSGYSGGETEQPNYRAVCSGTTGHAEVVQVIYNASVISYHDLLRIHLTTHDPTTLNQQGADTGTQYRSIILAQDDKQFAIAEAVIEEIQDVYSNPIVTQIAYLDVFHEAEIDHQEYYALNPDNRYCQAVIDPKLQKFKSLYADKLA
jgi:peptide methionine sulfoxide reductase msrA/msrB